MTNLFPITFRCTDTYYYISYPDILASMQGRDPKECDFILEFAFDRRQLAWTGSCKCTGRSVPKCRSCKNGHSRRDDAQIDSIISDVQQRVQRNLRVKLDDIKTFYLACKDFTKFFSSSILLIFLQNRYLLVRRKINTLSFDLESTLKKYMRKYEGNLILKFGKRCELRDDASESGIYQHVRMPTSSGNIFFPDFADISIRGKLLALSMSMKIIYRIFSLCHLRDDSKNRIYLMRQFEQCIFGMFFRQQMRKCK